MGNVVILGKNRPRPMSLERLGAAAKAAGEERLAEINAADRIGQLHGQRTALRVVLGDLEKIRAIASRAVALHRAHGVKAAEREYLIMACAFHDLGDEIAAGLEDKEPPAKPSPAERADAILAELAAKEQEPHRE